MFALRTRRLCLHACVTCILLSGWCLRAFAQSNENTTADFRSLAEAATAAREAGRTEEAVRDYQRALAMNPKWPEGWWYLGSTQYDGDQYAEGAQSFTKLVELAPTLGPAWSFLGLCEFELKDYTEALLHLEKAQKLGTGDDPEMARVSAYHLALLLIRNGEFEKASALLTQTFGESQLPQQAKTAFGLVLLRVPLLPDEIDPSRDALVQSAGAAQSLLIRGATNAREAFVTLFKDYPEVPYLHYGYGIALAAAGETQQALAQQREEAKLSPQSALPLVQISSLELALAQPDAALHSAEAAVTLAPDLSAAHQAMAQALKALGRDGSVQKESAESPSPASAREERIIQMYANSADPAQAKAAGGNRDRWNLAMMYYSTGDFRAASAALKSWVEARPTDGTAWAVLGLSEFELKDYDNALIHLERAQQLGLVGTPQSIESAQYHLGILLIAKGQFEAASKLLRQTTGFGPLAKEIRFARGMALLRISMLPDKVAPSESALVASAGEIAELLDQSNYERALPQFQQLIKDHPETPFLHYGYGVALASLSEYDEAAAEMRAEERISPKSELPLLRLASIALRQRLPGQALPSAQRAVALAPGSAEAHYLLGRTNLELGQNDAAVRELEMARKLEPNSPEVHFALARAYAKSNLPDKAEQERAIFVRLNAMAEQQRSAQGSQVYQGPHDQSGFSVLPASAQNATQPH